MPCDYGYSNFNQIRRLVRVGLFATVFLILQFFGKFLIIPVIGYGINIKAIWYAFILLSPRTDRSTQAMFGLVTPIIALLGGFSGINFFQIIVEYLFAYWIMMVLMLFCENSLFLNKHRGVKLVWLTFLVTLAFSLNFLMHFIAGFVWWVPGDFRGSAILNFGYIIPAYGIAVPLLVIAFR